MSKIKMRLRDKDPIKLKLKNAVQKMYPSLEDLYVVPSEEVQTFKSEDYYGYDSVKVDAINLQDKTITPTKEEQVVKADEEFSGLNEVTITKPTLQNKIVNPTKEKQTIKADNDFIGLEEVTINTPELQRKEIIPTSETQTIVADDNFIGLDEVVVKGDSDLKPANIKEGVDIFGVIGTAKTTGYEYVEFDPFNVFEILDNDTEPYESKMILLFINDGNNTVSISGNVFNGVTKIKSSDGQVIEKPSSGTFQIIFDDSKDVLSEQGLKVRYLIAYAPERATINLYDGNNLALSKRVLVYYFKNYDLNIGDRTFIYSGSITKLLKYDDNSNYYVRTKQIGYYGDSLLEFDLKTDNSGKSLEMSFYLASSLKKLKLNLQGITTLYYLCYGCGDLQEVEFYNCPEEAISQSSSFGMCNSLKKFKAYPYFLVNASDVFSNNGASNNLVEVSGVDFSSYSGGIGGAKNLVKLERIKRIGVAFDVRNCLVLSYDSLLNVINALDDLSGQTAKKLILGTVNKAKLEQTEEGIQAIALAVSKNWTVS